MTYEDQMRWELLNRWTEVVSALKELTQEIRNLRFDVREAKEGMKGIEDALIRQK